MVTTVLVGAAAMALAPVLVALVRRWVRIPLVVVEILLGLLIGPAVFGWVTEIPLVQTLSDFGLVLLFFMAGTEIDFAEIRGRPLRRSVSGWLISIAAGVGIGLLIGSSVPAGIYIAVALSSTALGTLLPVLIDARELRTPFGVAVTAVGAAGEFGPLLAISIFLSSRSPGVSAAVLLGFVALALGAILLAAKGKHHHLQRLSEATLHTSGQFAVRLVILLVCALAGVSIYLGLDMLLGAFAAGVVVQYLLASGPEAQAAVVKSKLDAVAFGIFVPIFFITTGINFNLRALLDAPQSLVLVLVFLVLLLVIRGLPGLLSLPKGASRSEARALALMSATGLPIIVAVTTIGVDRGELYDTTAAAMVGAGMLSVLLFPLIAMSQLRRAHPEQDEDTRARDRSDDR